MPRTPLAQRVVFDRLHEDALRLPLEGLLGELSPGACFPLLQDPRRSDRALVVGMMVLRPATRPWRPAALAHATATGVADEGNREVAPGLDLDIRRIRDWCYDVEGVGGSWPISGGNVVDAFRLALQYGTVDAVLAGSATVAREGLVAGARPGHLWQPYTPLSWPGLRGHRSVLEPAIAQMRRSWQDLGLLSARRWPAQIAISASGRSRRGEPDLLEARMFHARHPDGSPMESYLLTSEAGAERFRERARAKRLRIDDQLFVVSPARHPDRIDVARVPAMLRSRIDARLVEHDGGGVSLEAFASAGALAQVNLTLMRERPVRDLLASGARLGAADRDRVLESWPAAARLLPRQGGALSKTWQPVYALTEEGEGAEAVVVTFDPRGAGEAPGA